SSTAPSNCCSAIFLGSGRQLQTRPTSTPTTRQHTHTRQLLFITRSPKRTQCKNRQRASRRHATTNGPTPKKVYLTSFPSRTLEDKSSSFSRSLPPPGSLYEPRPPGENPPGSCHNLRSPFRASPGRPTQPRSHPCGA